MHRAEVLEREIVAHVDGELLTDPDRLAAHLYSAIQRERAALGNPIATVEVWRKRGALPRACTVVRRSVIA